MEHCDDNIHLLPDNHKYAHYGHHVAAQGHEDTLRAPDEQHQGRGRAAVRLPRRSLQVCGSLMDFWTGVLGGFLGAAGAELFHKIKNFLKNRIKKEKAGPKDPELN
jgi:hypothetical protein